MSAPGARATAPTEPAPREDAWRAVRLVAGREIRVRAASKAFRITTVVLVVLVVGMAVLPSVFSGRSSASTIGLTAATAPLESAVVAAARDVGEDVAVSLVGSAANGEAQVRDGTLDVLLTGTADAPEALAEQRPSAGVLTVLATVARQQALDQAVTALGGNPPAVSQRVSDAVVPLTTLQAPDPLQGQRIALGFVVGILIYVTLLGYGQTVAQGVVEEKTSRVVELLLATVRPWQLMAGKVLGIGLISLAQLALVAVAGTIAARATGVLSISLGDTIGAVVWAVVWYLLGFTIFALLFAAGGALVSRQEDVGTVATPMMLLIILPYVIGASVLPSDPQSRLVEVLSVVPLFAPMLMPWRIALDVAPGWEIALSVVLAVALVPALVWLTARVYTNAVVRTGARVSLREALRAA